MFVPCKDFHSSRKYLTLQKSWPRSNGLSYLSAASAIKKDFLFVSLSPGFLQQIGLDVAAGKLALGVEVDTDELALKQDPSVSFLRNQRCGKLS